MLHEDRLIDGQDADRGRCPWPREADMGQAVDSACTGAVRARRSDMRKEHHERGQRGFEADGRGLKKAVTLGYESGGAS